MTLIVNSNERPHMLSQLCDWFVQEWGELDPFDVRHGHVKTPSPLIALDEKKELIGGLAFTIAAKPRIDEKAIWINALLVAPKH
ncbi:hypothetical protein PsAD2_00911 [Pseudovibrio axinellae]|uniref:Acetyltransferase n=2 Tax=Pseudovibrio axinellae TaxID=989403 RepID=A0A161VA89_9HYPH|nr:hypothetical protein [Pseudovibrio axinellae]KZL20919.1 hypothetical protein PsAD2_00911 [Pseudovibrio axinellae]SEQ65846.1 hypothetical protein SAMN05421798_103366 [Pseudovibrio axinellae]